VVLLSDHGFRNGGDRPRDVAPDIDGKPAKWHRLYGVAVISGPGIEPGSLQSVTLLDVAPTILKLAGLPIAEDMRGKPLVAPGGSPAAPEAIASYNFDPAAAAARQELAAKASDEGQEEMLENLRSLGYIGGGGQPAAEDPAGGARGQASPGTLTSHGNMGAVHLQNRELALAKREFEAALAISPNYYPALIGLSEVLVQEGRKREAFDLVRRAMRDSRAPEPGVYMHYASLAPEAGAAEEAAQTLLRLRREKPDVAEIAIGQAIMAHRESKYEESERLLKEALRIDPANNEAITRLMWYRRKQGNEEVLEPDVRAALEINPGSVLHRNLLGLILERKGDYRGAEREFKHALESAPDFGGTLANIGSLYGRTGRLDEAVTILTKALEIEPRNLECRVNLGASLGKLGRVEEALAVLEAGRGVHEASPELLNALAVAYANSGDPARAESLLRESLSLRPEQPTVRSMLRQLQGAG